MSNAHYESMGLGTDAASQAWVESTNDVCKRLIEGGLDETKALDFFGRAMPPEVMDFLFRNPDFVEEGSPVDKLLVGLVADESVGSAELAGLST